MRKTCGSVSALEVIEGLQPDQIGNADTFQIA